MADLSLLCEVFLCEVFLSFLHKEKNKYIVNTFLSIRNWLDCGKGPLQTKWTMICMIMYKALFVDYV